MVKDYYEGRLVNNVARDSTAISAREKQANTIVLWTVPMMRRVFLSLYRTDAGFRLSIRIQEGKTYETLLMKRPRNTIRSAQL